VGFLTTGRRDFPARSFVFNKRKHNDYQGVLKEVNYGFEIPADNKPQQEGRSEAYEEF
jgi:hypothetical protein